MPIERVAAAVISDEGHLLAYSVADTMSACDEAAEKRHGSDAWNTMKERGARVVQCRIVVDEAALAPDRSWDALRKRPSISR